MGAKFKNRMCGRAPIGCWSTVPNNSWEKFFPIFRTQSLNAMFVFEKNQMNTPDKSLKFKYIAVMWLYTLLHF